jgi:hypothetical protein
MDIQNLMGKHDKVFGQIPPGVPPDRGFEHTIELEEGHKLVITTPYQHSKRFKDELRRPSKNFWRWGTSDPTLVLLLRP